MVSSYMPPFVVTPFGGLTTFALGGVLMGIPRHPRLGVDAIAIAPLRPSRVSAGLGQTCWDRRESAPGSPGRGIGPSRERCFRQCSGPLRLGELATCRGLLGELLS